MTSKPGMGLHPGLTAAPDAKVPGVPRDRCSRAGALITRHRPFVIALAAGAVLRGIAALGCPGALWFSDSFVYIGDTLRFRPDAARAVGYSFFRRALEPFRSLVLVTGDGAGHRRHDLRGGTALRGIAAMGLRGRAPRAARRVRDAAC